MALSCILNGWQEFHNFSCRSNEVLPNRPVEPNKRMEDNNIKNCM